MLLSPLDELERARRKAGPSLGQLLRDLIHQIRALLRDEIRMARAEMAEKAAKMSRQVGAVAIGGVVALLGAVALVGAAGIGLACLMIFEGVHPLVALWLAPLIVGAGLGIAGYAMIHKGAATLRHASISPDRTVETLKETGQWLHQKAS